MNIPQKLSQFGSGLVGPSTAYQPPNTADGALSNLTLIISNMIGFATIVGGLFFIVYFILAAYKWLGSSGDAGKLNESRNQMLHGVLGLLIIVAAYSIVGLIGFLIGFNLLNPAEQICKIAPGGC